MTFIIEEPSIVFTMTKLGAHRQDSCQNAIFKLKWKVAMSHMWRALETKEQTSKGTRADPNIETLEAILK